MDGVESMDASRRGTGVARAISLERVSLAWMIVEGSVAIGAGLAAHSLPLTAFGADSVIELVAGAILLWRLILQTRGTSMGDVERAERRASAVVGVALLILALYMVATAAYDLSTRVPSHATAVGLALAVVSGLVMPYLALMKKRIGTQIGSPALRADGSCSMVCAYMAWVLLAGLVVQAAFGWWWINAAGGLSLVYFVLAEGLESVRDARSPDPSP